MSDYLPRRQREQRAYRLTLATGGSAVASVVVLVLTIAGVTSFFLLFLLVLLTAALAWGLRRTLGQMVEEPVGRALISRASGRGLRVGVVDGALQFDWTPGETS